MEWDDLEILLMYLTVVAVLIILGLWKAGELLYGLWVWL